MACAPQKNTLWWSSCITLDVDGWSLKADTFHQLKDSIKGLSIKGQTLASLS